MYHRQSSRALRAQRGATAISYALLLGLISIGSLTVVEQVGTEVDGLFNTVSDRLRGGTASGSGSDDEPGPDTFSFSTCGHSGPIGPDSGLCQAAYAGTSLAGAVSIIGSEPGFQRFTVPYSGRWRLDVTGAAGGDGAVGTPGGNGARLVAEMTLTQGTELIVAVGHQGADYAGRGGAGGGGSAVALTDDTALVVAGGGGGGADGDAGVDASATLVGVGDSGAGSALGSAANAAPAGAGWVGSFDYLNNPSQRTASFTAGWSGYVENDLFLRSGSFGGGGSGVTDPDGPGEDRGGGGGGYRGGDAVVLNAGRGGGSFVNSAGGFATDIVSQQDGVGTGDGAVILRFLD